MSSETVTGPWTGESAGASALYVPGGPSAIGPDSVVTASVSASRPVIDQVAVPPGHPVTCIENGVPQNSVVVVPPAWLVLSPRVTFGGSGAGALNTAFVPPEFTTVCPASAPNSVGEGGSTSTL